MTGLTKWLTPPFGQKRQGLQHLTYQHMKVPWALF